MGGPLERWRDETCGICPGQVLGPGSFDVVERPSRELAYNAQRGWRATPEGEPACVHPFRVGMPPAPYASAGASLPDLSRPVVVPGPPPEVLELPDSINDLSAWMVAHLRAANGNPTAALVARIERTASQRWAPGEVVAVLRRVLSVELART